MDVWFVGRQPISHFKQAPSRKNDELGVKVNSLLRSMRGIGSLIEYGMWLLCIDLFHEGTGLCWSSQAQQGCIRLCMAHKGRVGKQAFSRILQCRQGQLR